jgi:hypothetical protein
MVLKSHGSSLSLPLHIAWHDHTWASRSWGLIWFWSVEVASGGTDLYWIIFTYGIGKFLKHLFHPPSHHSCSTCELGRLMQSYTCVGVIALMSLSAVLGLFNFAAHQLSFTHPSLIWHWQFLSSFLATSRQTKGCWSCITCFCAQDS